MYSPYSADFSKSPYPTIFHEHGQQFRSMATSSLSTRHREQLNCPFNWAILKPHGAVKVVSGETPVGAMRPMCSCNHTIFCHSGQPRLPPPAVRLAEGLTDDNQDHLLAVSRDCTLKIKKNRGKHNIRDVWTVYYQMIANLNY